MTDGAVAAAAIFGLWFAGSVCVAFDVPVAARRLRRVDHFRVFCAWTMFTAAPDGYTWYAIDYRAATSDAAWARWVPFSGWHPFGWVISPRQTRAQALQRLARNLERRLAEAPVTERGRIARPFETLIADLVTAHRPQEPGDLDVRIVRTGFGPAPSAVIWSFTTSRVRHA